ncbi:MAG: hypothetical protein PUB98_10060 [Clostridiales bacterium]|nr:hypothetical protein [Clostridiales bacterium]
MERITTNDGGEKMKRLGCFISALILIGIILVSVVADVNHGHGPGGHGEETHGEETQHGEETHGEEAQHGEETHGEETDSQTKEEGH